MPRTKQTARKSAQPAPPPQLTAEQQRLLDMAHVAEQIARLLSTYDFELHTVAPLVETFIQELADEGLDNS